MQAIPAHHTNASIFWPCCAGQSYFQHNQISVNLGNMVKPKASSSSDQYSQSRINTHHLNTPKSSQNPHWTNAINSIFTNDQDYAITLHLVFTASIPSHSNMANTGHSCAYQYEWPCLHCFICQLTITDVHSLYHYKYRLQPSLSISNAA